MELKSRLRESGWINGEERRLCGKINICLVNSFSWLPYGLIDLPTSVHIHFDSSGNDSSIIQRNRNNKDDDRSSNDSFNNDNASSQQYLIYFNSVI